MLAPPAQAVDGARGEFLARAGLSAEKHRYITISREPNLLNRAQVCRAVADQSREARRAVQYLSRRVSLPARLQALVQTEADPGWVQWFEQIIIESGQNLVRLLC